MKPPAFQFYADDFLAGTITMSHEERGLYIALLCLNWSQGSFSDTEATRLAANGSAIAEPCFSHVLAKFEKGDDGNYRNARLEAERAKQDAYRKNRSKAGEKGAKKRWGNGKAIAKPCDSHDTSIASHMANDSSPSPSPSPIDKQTKGAGGKPESVGQIEEFAKLHDLPTEHAAPFFDYFTSNGWKVGGKATMKDWHAAFRNWCRNANKMSRTAPDADMFDRIPDKYLNAF